MTCLRLLCAYLVTLCASAAPLLWRDPGPVAGLDLAAGPGGTAKAPRPPFKFVKEELGGTAPKVVVEDAAGRSWMVKFGPEVKAETFATRVAWAMGYAAGPTYFVPSGAINGVTGLTRAAPSLRDGRFTEARFELRGDPAFRFVKAGGWDLRDKALAGTHELAGLKILAMLLANWDVKPENFAIVEVNGVPMLAITDWGASMGRAGDFSYRSKWDCPAFSTLR